MNLKEFIKNKIENKDLFEQLIEKMPSSKTENYKHTNLKKLYEHDFATTNIKEKHLVNKFRKSSYDFLFIENGELQEKLSKYDKNKLQIKKQNKKNLPNKKDLFFETLPKILAKEELQIKIKDSYKLEIINKIDSAEFYDKSIEILHSTDVEIVETFIGNENHNSLLVSNLNIVIQNNAKLIYHLLQTNNEKLCLITNNKILQKAESLFHIFTLNNKSKFIRNNINSSFHGNNSKAFLYGIFATNDREHFDNFVQLDHLNDNCESLQLYKGVLDKDSSAAFRGEIFVDELTTGTKANQLNRNILLSNSAKIHSKPHLKIYTEDVICSHGSSTGQIDKEMIFYLQSRGINKNEAQKIIVQSFFNDIIEKVENDKLKKIYKIS